MAICAKDNRDYAACLKNAVDFLVIYTINFSGCFLLCVFAYGNTGKDKVKKTDTENMKISVDG
jgi:hypothetical protein